MLKFFWSVLLTVPMIASFFDGTVKKNLAVISHVTFWMVAQNLLVIAVVVLSFYGLWKLHPLFNWSLFSLFKDGDEEVSGKNINLIPSDVKYFGLLFTILLIINLPSFAMMEEKWFRLGTENWQQGLYLSFLFGMVHCLVGVPIGAGIVISIAGLWFTHQYFIGGVELSALHHTTYNLIIFSVLFLGLVCKHISELRESNAEMV